MMMKPVSRSMRRMGWSMLVAVGSVVAMTAPAEEGMFAGERVELEEIVVTGSRLRLGEVEGVSPVTMFNRAEIDALGVSSVADVMKFLPQQPYNRPDFYRADGAKFAELRGLGADTTLVLVNGRRTVPSASSAVANAFDLNSIPLAAVERVEVLSDAASAVYGADAVGGVVNIILKRAVEQPVVDLHYGAARGGAEEQRASFSVGHSGERLRGSAILDYFHTDSLLGQDRSLWRDQDYRRFGGTDQRSTNSNPGNVSSRSGGNLPGLNSPIAAVPVGSSGEGLTPADFVATAGQRNLESLARYDAIVPEVERMSAVLFGEFEFRPEFVVFGEAMYAKRDRDSASAPPSVASRPVPASNAFNPFGVPVTSNFLVEGIGPRHSKVESELLRGVAGVRGQLGTWDWEVAMLGSREEASSWTEGALNAIALAQSLASSDPALALNVFQDGPGGSPTLLRSLVASPTVAEYVSDGSLANAFVRGSLGSLPAGSVEAVLGAEWRRDAMYYDSTLFVDENRHAVAGFAEVNVPLVSAAMEWPGVHRLSLKLAGRYDEYSDFGNTVNPQYGLVWMPVQDLTLRASYGTSFRPPSLFELYAPRVSLPLPVNDPRRNNEIADATAISGGNPDLLPVEGESLTAGFVWTPSAMSGLRVAASWWQVELDQRVSFLPYQVVLAYESIFADRVVRADPSAADVAAGLPGPLVSVDISRVNFGRIDTRGADVSVNYGFESKSGEWRLSLAATWVDRYLSDELPGQAPTNRVGVANVFGTITRWTGNAGVNWTRGPWGADVIGRYVAAYDDAVGVAAAPTGRRMPGQTFVDVQLRWDSAGSSGTTSAWWGGLRLTLGASNVLDVAPDYSEIGGTLGFDTSQGDLRQRFLYVDLSKRF